MSSQRGNASRSRPQKYKNSSKFKNNLHDKSDLTKQMNETVISDCCARCTEIIQWKINFKKYKLLGQPKKCVNCLEKRVTNSYHIICSVCGIKDSICRKCKIKFQPRDEESSKNEKETWNVEKNASKTIENDAGNKKDNNDNADDFNSDEDKVEGDKENGIKEEENDDKVKHDKEDNGNDKSDKGNDDNDQINVNRIKLDAS